MRNATDVLYESRQLFRDNGIRFGGSKLFRALLAAARAEGWPTHQAARAGLKQVDLAINERAAADQRIAARADGRAPYMLVYYEVDKAYGGPEEGGWWYDTGTFVRVSYRCFTDPEDAWNACRRANRLIERLQRRKTPTSSMAYAGGRYRAGVYRDKAPKWFPEVRPVYE